MALFPGPQQSVFWHDFEGLTDGNLFKDLGPYGLHATPQAGFVAPNYGLARNTHGKGYANFTGAANVYATLPLRFYNYAPTAQYTYVLVAQHDATGAGGFVFYCRNGGATRGMFLYHNAAQRLNSISYDATGGNTQLGDAADVPLSPRTRTSLYSMNRPWVMGTIWHDRVAFAPAWGGGVTTGIAYDTAVVPTIGAQSGPANYFVGRMYWLILFPFVFTDSEAKAMSAWLMDQV